MQIFNSGFFWFAEGILFCVMVLGLRSFSLDRSIPLTWWKWVAFGVWALLTGFTIAFVGTSLGEGEPTAAIRGGLMFGFVAIIAAVVLWRVWMIGTPSQTTEKVAES